MTRAAFDVCTCGHPWREHEESFGEGDAGCTGDVRILYPGAPECTAPCYCEAFVLWYVDPL
jgi:hypothetical protein